MAYITNYNAERIIEVVDRKEFDKKEPLFKFKKLLMFTKREESQLLAYKAFMKDSGEDKLAVYKKIEKDASTFFVKNNKRKPAYHSRVDCPHLNADYKEYMIPDSIREQGDEACIQFQKWFRKNQRLFRENIDSFNKLLWSKYHVTSLVLGTLENSGIQSFSNMTLEEIDQKLEELIAESNEYYFNERNNPVLYKFSKRLYLADPSKPLPKNDLGMSDKEIKEILAEYRDKYKKPIMRLLKHYYRAKYNPDLKCDERILEQLGFVPCQECCKTKYRNYKGH